MTTGLTWLIRCAVNLLFCATAKSARVTGKTWAKGGIGREGGCQQALLVQVPIACKQALSLSCTAPVMQLNIHPRPVDGPRKSS